MKKGRKGKEKKRGGGEAFALAVCSYQKVLMQAPDAL